MQENKWARLLAYATGRVNQKLLLQTANAGHGGKRETQPVDVGQCGACHPAMKTHVVEFAAQRSQARFYIAKAIPVSELGKGHRQILIPTREASRPRISAVASDTSPKLAIRQKAQQLREDGSTLVHRPLWTVADSISRPVAVQIAASQNPAQRSERKALADGEIFVSRTLVTSFQERAHPAVG